MLFDTHTHIFLNSIEEETIINRLKENNVKHIAHIGVDIESSEKCIVLAKKYNDISVASVGIHPCYTDGLKGNIEENIEKLEKMIIENKETVKAIGECGLDYHYTENYNKKELQEKYFKAQIELAKKYNLGVVIHSRDAKEETLRIIKETGLKKFILHCFAEDLDFAMKAIYYSPEAKISFSGIVTYKSAQSIQNTAANIALDRVLVETDCPYLAPQKYRGEENFPHYVRYNLDKVISLRLENGKNETPEKIENQIYKNSLEFFGVK